MMCNCTSVENGRKEEAAIGGASRKKLGGVKPLAEILSTIACHGGTLSATNKVAVTWCTASSATRTWYSDGSCQYAIHIFCSALARSRAMTREHQDATSKPFAKRKCWCFFESRRHARLLWWRVAFKRFIESRQNMCTQIGRFWHKVDLLIATNMMQSHKNGAEFERSMPWHVAKVIPSSLADWVRDDP